MKTVKIAVRSGTSSSGKYRGRLHRMGFEDGPRDRFVKVCSSASELERIRRFCDRKGLTFFYDNGYGQKKYNYRTIYFDFHPPVKGNKYRCVYCGKLYEKGIITIDHIYPAALVSKDLRLQRRLHRRGIESLDDPANLAAACPICNRLKSDDLKGWAAKAKRGSRESYWKSRRFFRALVLVLALLLIVYAVIYLFFPDVWQLLTTRVREWTEMIILKL